MTFNFDTTYLKLNSDLYSKVTPEKIKNPEIVLLNKELLQNLNIKETEDLKEILSGNKLLGTSIAQAYAGHQFGHLNNLGDGRAVLLGEHVYNKSRVDIQLKGSGITPYSRGGDGRATSDSMVREYLYSYMLTNLGIKSSQSLAVLLTNQKVQRETLKDGALLVRMMTSHIRVGTFEYVSYTSKPEELAEFTDYVINRHYPKTKDNYLLFFEEVMKAQITMVVDWLRVGFIHGVMNTDNMSIIGETFDYGPCAFMNSYDLKTKYSEIDRYGRYTFGNQKDILFWNLQRFAQSLIPIIDQDKEISISKLEKSLNKFESLFEDKFQTMMKAKLGIKENEEAKEIIKETLSFLEKTKADYTNMFIELQDPNSFSDKVFKTKKFLELRKKISKIGLDKEIMNKANPQRILRNYIVEEAINTYVKNKDLNKINNLLKAMKDPYQKNREFELYQYPPKDEYDKKYSTHCNT